MTAMVTLAAIAGAHGVRGEVRVKLFADDAGSFTCHRSFDAGGRTLTLVQARPASGVLIARFAEITDRNAAEALRGTVLAVPRSALPPLAEGEYYHADYIGMAVTLADGTPVGTVKSIENFGASDILDIALVAGGTVMVPFVADAVTEADGRLLVAAEWLA